MPSAKASRTPNRVDRTEHGAPIVAGERTVTPVARVSGWRGCKRSDREVGAGGWLRVTPVEVVVHEQDGTEQRIAIVDPFAAPRQGIVRLALLAAAGCWLIMLLAGRRSRRRPRQKKEETA